MHLCPRVLVLHIKRFIFNHAAKIAIKRNDSIALSATLDISRFCAQERKFCSPELAAASPTYKLRSFLNHIGEDNVGHYISYSRTNDNIWFVCVLRRAGNAWCRLHQNDTHVYKITMADALLAAQDAYILFFEVSFTDLVVRFVCISWISSICLHHLHQLKSLFSAMSREMCSSQR